MLLVFLRFFFFTCFYMFHFFHYKFFEIFVYNFGFLDFFKRLFYFCYFCYCFSWGGGIFSKFLRLLLKVTEVATEHQKLPNIRKNRIKDLFWQKSLGRSWLYLLVILKVVLIIKWQVFLTDPV